MLRTRQYRFTGKFPNWNVTDLAPSIPLVDAVGTVNDIISVGRDGVRSFVNVMQYGDVQKDETGKRINSVLARDVTADAKVWHIPSRKQVYVKPNTDSVLWIYHYAQRNSATGEVGAWTKRYLTDEVRHIWEDGNNVYMAVGSKICLIDADIGSYAVPVLQSSIAYDDTDIAFDDMDIGAGVYIYIRPGTVDGEEFPARITGQRLTSSFMFNPVHYTLQLSADIDGTGEVAFGGFREAINFVGADDVAFDDDEVAFDDTDIAAGSTFWKRDLFFESQLTEDMVPELTINTGSAGVRFLSVDYSEV